jgi:hypothetical protein
MCSPGRFRRATTALTHTTGSSPCEGLSIPITSDRRRQRLGARSNTLEGTSFRRVFLCVFLLSQHAVPSSKQGPQ